MKSAAPCLIASTASFTVPKPVMTMPMMSGYRSSAASRTSRPPMPGRRRSVIRMSKANSARRCERFLAAARLLDRETVVGQPLGDRRPQRALVVDDQQMFLGISHLGRAAVF